MVGTRNRKRLICCAVVACRNSWLGAIQKTTGTSCCNKLPTSLSLSMYNCTLPRELLRYRFTDAPMACRSRNLQPRNKKNTAGVAIRHPWCFETEDTPLHPGQIQALALRAYLTHDSYSGSRAETKKRLDRSTQYGNFKNHHYRYR